MALFNLYQIGGNSGGGGGNGDELLGFIGGPATYIPSDWFSYTSYNSMNYSSKEYPLALLKYNITSIYAPKVSWIGSSAFCYHKNIKAVICPNCERVDSYAFNSTNISMIELGSSCVTYFPILSLHSLTNIKGGLILGSSTADISRSYISSNNFNYGFNGLGPLFGSITILNQYLPQYLLNFYDGGCYEDTLSIYLPNVLTMWGKQKNSTNTGDESYYCRVINGGYEGTYHIYLPSTVSQISAIASGFSTCYLYLSEATSVPALLTSNTLFSNGSYSRIYVPKSLYNNFKTATNWTRYSNIIYSIQ